MKPYRGLTKDGTMIYGGCVQIFEKYYIVSDPHECGWTGGKILHHEIWGFREVIPETVAQQVGKQDKNKDEIYEGDIITLSYGIPPTQDTLIIEYADDEIIADISVSGWWMRNIRPNGCSASLCKTYEGDIEIIGNIHQNPKLLEKPNDTTN